MIDLERHFIGRIMGLDRTALPALASLAALRAQGMGHDQLAGRFDGAGVGTIAVQRMGATAVVPLRGFITRDPLLGYLFGGTSPDALVRALQEAVADRQVSTVVIVCDSPGGEVSLVQEAAAEIRRLRSLKLILAIARVQMCSAAYWLAAQASVVIASPSAEIGSVGVFAMHIDESGLNARIGIEPTYISSTPEKVEGSSAGPLSDDALAFVQSQVNQTYATFIADLALGRRTSESAVRNNFGSGRTFGAAEAVQRGMADRVGTSQSVLPVSADGGGRQALAATFSHYDDERVAADRDAIAIAIALAAD